MNDNGAIIPINPETEAIKSLVQLKSNYGVARLANLTTAELKQLQRQWYDQAVKNNVITLLQILLMQAGKPDGTGNTMKWEQGEIVAVYDLASNSLMIRVNGALVCATYSVGNEVFVPGKWLAVAMDALDKIEISAKRQAETMEQAQRRDLITLLGAQV